MVHSRLSVYPANPYKHRKAAEFCFCILSINKFLVLMALQRDFKVGDIPGTQREQIALFGIHRDNLWATALSCGRRTNCALSARGARLHALYSGTILLFFISGGFWESVAAPTVLTPPPPLQGPQDLPETTRKIFWSCPEVF